MIPQNDNFFFKLTCMYHKNSSFYSDINRVVPQTADGVMYLKLMPRTAATTSTSSTSTNLRVKHSSLIADWKRRKKILSSHTGIALEIIIKLFVVIVIWNRIAVKKNASGKFWSSYVFNLNTRCISICI